MLRTISASTSFVSNFMVDKTYYSDDVVLLVILCEQIVSVMYNDNVPGPQWTSL